MKKLVQDMAGWGGNPYAWLHLVAELVVLDEVFPQKEASNNASSAVPSMPSREQLT